MNCSNARLAVAESRLGVYRELSAELRRLLRSTRARFSAVRGTDPAASGAGTGTWRRLVTAQALPVPTLASTNCAPTILLVSPVCPCRRPPPVLAAAAPGAAAAPRTERERLPVEAPADDEVHVGVASDVSHFIATAGAATMPLFHLSLFVSGVSPGLNEMVPLLVWSISLSLRTYG